MISNTFLCFTLSRCISQQNTSGAFSTISKGVALIRSSTLCVTPIFILISYSYYFYYSQAFVTQEMRSNTPLPPKRLPIPAAIITNVIFFMLLYAPDFGYSIVSEAVTPLSPTSPDFLAYPHPVPSPQTHNTPSAAAESLPAMSQNEDPSSGYRSLSLLYPPYCNFHKL